MRTTTYAKLRPDERRALTEDELRDLVVGVEVRFWAVGVGEQYRVGWGKAEEAWIEKDGSTSIKMFGSNEWHTLAPREILKVRK